MATAAAEKRTYTAEELYQLSEDDRRYELVRGELRERPFGSMIHGITAGNLSCALGYYVLERKLGLPFLAGTGFVLERNPDTVLAPDLAFISRERAPQRLSPWFSTTIPDLLMEVVEAGESYSAVMEALMQWLTAGVRLVWVVDPQSRTVCVSRSLKEGRLLTEADTLDGGDLAPGFSLPVAKIFA